MFTLKGLILAIGAQGIDRLKRQATIGILQWPQARSTAGNGLPITLKELQIGFAPA